MLFFQVDWDLLSFRRIKKMSKEKWRNELFWYLLKEGEITVVLVTRDLIDEAESETTPLSLSESFLCRASYDEKNLLSRAEDFDRFSTSSFLFTQCCCALVLKVSHCLLAFEHLPSGLGALDSKTGNQFNLTRLIANPPWDLCRTAFCNWTCDSLFVFLSSS